VRDLHEAFGDEQSPANKGGTVRDLPTTLGYEQGPADKGGTVRDSLRAQAS
jgi:hypothetical protein